MTKLTQGWTQLQTNQEQFDALYYEKGKWLTGVKDSDSVQKKTNQTEKGKGIWNLRGRALKNTHWQTDLSKEGSAGQQDTGETNRDGRDKPETKNMSIKQNKREMQNNNTSINTRKTQNQILNKENKTGKKKTGQWHKNYRDKSIKVQQEFDGRALSRTNRTHFENF